MQQYPILQPTMPPIPLDPLLEAALARKNLWESNRRAPKGLSVILPEDYHEQQAALEPSEEDEEQAEVFKILMICGAVLFLFIIILIVLRVLILLKSCQHKQLNVSE